MCTLSVYFSDPMDQTDPLSRGTMVCWMPDLHPRKGVEPSRSNPNAIEVPADEWAQVKEQLELVPHLTEQLQVMIQQHEQLLSLLAAQQQKEQQ